MSVCVGVCGGWTHTLFSGCTRGLSVHGKEEIICKEVVYFLRRVRCGYSGRYIGINLYVADCSGNKKFNRYTE